MSAVDGPPRDKTVGRASNRAIRTGRNVLTDSRRHEELEDRRARRFRGEGTRLQADLARFVRAVYRLDATEEQMERSKMPSETSRHGVRSG